MANPLENVSCARLPAAVLPALAGLRCLPELAVRLEGAYDWLYWPAGEERVLRCLLPLAGVELYERRDGHWYRHGRRLPSFEVAASAGGQRLEQVLFPDRIDPEPPPVLALRPDGIRLVRDNRLRPATAVRCGLVELARWAETATSAGLAGLRAARSGERVLLLGQRLPLLPRGQRLWGERVLVPLGFRPDPSLPERALLEAVGVGGGELVVLDADGAEVLAVNVFRPLSRAAVRLAVGGAG
jgi:hypothetical protein